MAWVNDNAGWREREPSILPPEPRPEKERQHLFSRQTVTTLMWLAAASGVFAGLGLGVIAFLASWAKPWAWALAGGVMGSGAVWSLLLVRWLDLTRPLEKITGLDIDGDGLVGDEKPAEPETVRVEMKREDGSFVNTQLPVSRERVSDLARGLLSGVPFSERQWSGAGAAFSQSEFRDLRETMLRAGWIRWTDPRYPRLGIELTKPGKRVLQTFAGPAYSSAPSPVQTGNIPAE